jgi:SAM-dependent methyltransferase
VSRPAMRGAQAATLVRMAGPANEAMRQAWDGPEGAQWSELAEGFERASREHRAVLLGAAALTPAEDVLDVGCGNGALTLQAGAAVEPGRAVGIDLSSAMLANGRARAAAEGRSNVSFVHGDAQVYAFEPRSFDVVVSNVGAMFFDDQDAAFTNLHEALKPGGRIVLLVWQALENNEWLKELRRALALGRDLPSPVVGTPGPFGLADPDSTCELLARTGYSGIAIEDMRLQMLLGDDVESAYAFVSKMGNTRGLLDELDEDDRIIALGNLRSVLAEHATPQGVVLGTASWLVTAIA